MATVQNILDEKGGNVFSVPPDTSVYHALELMVEKNVSSLLITENGKLAGIFTERDYARKVVLKGKSSKETLVSDIMTANVITVTPNNSIDECMKLMTGKFIRHLPVMENDKLLGVVSIGDLVRAIIHEQKFIIENMQQYIAGT
ncbi:MAG: CBS domain-containing protein [Ferruginibacter sp.]|nr:CBS domain-containing protein [Bacteroidota bacterium]MBX2919582.1 CBS domain-containing protein [Ferruginibacter sp.]